MIRFSKPYVAVILLMLLTYASTLWVRTPPVDATKSVILERLPKQMGKWQRIEEGQIDQAAVQQLGSNQTLIRKYSDRNGKAIELIIIYYKDQEFEAQVHSPQHCLPGSGWDIEKRGQFDLPDKKPGVAATKLSINKEGNRREVLYWFVAGNNVVRNEYHLKLQILKNRLLHKPIAVYFFRIVTVDSKENDIEEDRMLKEFLSDAYESLKILTAG